MGSLLLRAMSGFGTLVLGITVPLGGYLVYCNWFFLTLLYITVVVVGIGILHYISLLFLSLSYKFLTNDPCIQLNDPGPPWI